VHKLTAQALYVEHRLPQTIGERDCLRGRWRPAVAFTTLFPRRIPSLRRFISRRNFVRGTAPAPPLAVAAPTIIPSSALGDDKVRRTEQPHHARLHRIGKQASGHLGSLTGKADTQTLAVCDIHKLRRESAKETVDKMYAKLERKGAKACDAYVDFHEVLARKDIDAVVIGTPDHWHTIPNIEACKAGKDIYCEKPLTLTIHEAKTVIEAVRKHDRVFQTGSQHASSGPFREVCEYIQNGPAGQDQGSAYRRRRDQQTLRPARRAGGSECRFQRLARPGARAGVQRDPLPQGFAEQLFVQPRLARLPRIQRRLCDGLGRASLRHHSVGPGMDGSGPNEILPPEKQGDQFGAKFIYHKTPVGDNIVAPTSTRSTKG